MSQMHWSKSWFPAMQTQLETRTALLGVPRIAIRRERKNIFDKRLGDGLERKVKSAASEAPIPIRRSVISSTYELDGRSGHSVLEFHVPADGSYGFSWSYGNTEHGPETVGAVGSGVGGRIMWTLFTGLLAMFGGFGSGFIVFVATFVLRRNARARLEIANPALTGQP
jgi:hypothetical protein